MAIFSAGGPLHAEKQNLDAYITKIVRVNRASFKLSILPRKLATSQSKTKNTLSKATFKKKNHQASAPHILSVIYWSV
jgi:hypothetical protein